MRFQAVYGNMGQEWPEKRKGLFKEYLKNTVNKYIEKDVYREMKLGIVGLPKRRKKYIIQFTDKSRSRIRKLSVLYHRPERGRCSGTGFPLEALIGSLQLREDHTGCDRVRRYRRSRKRVHPKGEGLWKPVPREYP